MSLELILQALSSPFSVLVLYLLDKYGEMKLTDILIHLGFSKYKAVRKAVLLLAEVGLVRIAVKKITPRVNAWTIRITDRGKRIIEAIKSIA
ncbi:MAG: hypothetical protein NDP22_01245 [Crenarchaeota archaeon]|nr:hypothetical protein [Thermoproteota archaeon]